MEPLIWIRELTLKAHLLHHVASNRKERQHISRYSLSPGRGNSSNGSSTSISCKIFPSLLVIMNLRPCQNYIYCNLPALSERKQLVLLGSKVTVLNGNHLHCFIKMNSRSLNVLRLKRIIQDSRLRYVIFVRPFRLLPVERIKDV